MKKIILIAISGIFVILLIVYVPSYYTSVQLEPQSQCHNLQIRFNETSDNEVRIVESNQYNFIIRFEIDYTPTYLYSEVLNNLQINLQMLETYTNNAVCSHNGIFLPHYNSDTIISRDEGKGWFWLENEKGDVTATCTVWDNDPPISPQSDPHAITHYYLREVVYYKFDVNIIGTIVLTVPNIGSYTYEYDGPLLVKNVQITNVTKHSAQVNWYITQDATDITVILGKRMQDEIYWFKTYTIQQQGRACQIYIDYLELGTTYYGKIRINDIDYTMFEFTTLSEEDQESNGEEDQGSGTTIHSICTGVLSLIFMIGFILALLYIARKTKGKSASASIKSTIRRKLK